jgi:CheY-like chemotaxis protein
MKKGNVLIYQGEVPMEELTRALVERGWDILPARDLEAGGADYSADLIIVDQVITSSTGTLDEIGSRFPGTPVFTYTPPSESSGNDQKRGSLSHLGISCAADELGKMVETMLYAYRRGGRPAPPPESMAHYERALDVLYEINSPLSVILANANLLLSSDKSVQPYARGVVKEIRLAIDSIVNMTKEFGDRTSHLLPGVVRQEPPPTLYSKDRRRILVVDDEEAICRVLKRSLGSEYEVSVAHDGKEALTMAEESNFDLFIVDLHMPHMKGIDLMKEFRKRQKNPRPILVITGYLDDDDAMEAVKKGAHGCFYKPLNLEEIQAFVRQILL